MDYAGGVIAERRRNPGDDLLSQFCLAEIDGERLTEREVLLTTTTLIMAGVESLGGFTVMFGLNMADFADARREIVADPTLLPDAIEESLRYNTSGQRFRRFLMKDVAAAWTDHEGRGLRLPGLRRGQSRRAAVPGCGSLRHPAQAAHSPRLWRRRACLPRVHGGAHGGADHVRGVPGGVSANSRRVHQQLPWMPSTTFRSPMRLDLAMP